MSKTVSLHKDTEVQFPDHCVGCGISQPSRVVNIGTSSSVSSSMIFGVFAQRFFFNFPACETCQQSFENDQSKSLLLTVTIIIISLFVLFLVDSKLLAFGVIIVLAILVMVLFEIFFPSSVEGAVDITFFKDTFYYKFRDSEYAHAFATLNQIDSTMKGD